MSKLLVNCSDYNGHKDVKFMMDSSDFRLKDSSSGYEIICKGTYKKKTLVCENGDSYTVHEDWSVSLIGKQELVDHAI